MAQFILFNQNILIPDSYIQDYKMDQKSYTAAVNAKNEFYAWYKKRSGIEDVLKNYTEIAVKLVDKYAISPLFNSLSSFGIYDVSEGSYVEQCVDCSEIDDSFEKILYELEKIIDDQNEMKQYRAIRKAYRGRMVGGGFGISGAITGAVEAGAINATTGMAHSAVNAVGNMGSSIAASAKKVSLYGNNQTKEDLAIGICVSIICTYENHKQLINKYIKRYYEKGFNVDKAKALFENAMRFSDKRELLLVESITKYPDETVFAYIFKNYKSERKNVYVMGNVFDIDIGKYVEESFMALYTDEVKVSAQKVDVIKREIIATMQDFGISTSATLEKVNYDELIRIANKYISATEEESIQQYMVEFNEYDSPFKQKKRVVQEKGIWQLASKYDVIFSSEEIEVVLKRYYTEAAQKNEAKAQNAKKKIVEIMNVLGVKTSVTFDQLEKDCIARICKNLENADEVTCNHIRDKIMRYDAVEKNKKEYLDRVQKQIETIWTKEDGEVFDNIYFNTNIYDQNEINNSIEFIRKKGRTTNAERYIAALQACNEKSIEDARKFQKKETKTSNTVGIVLLLAGILCFLIESPLAVIAIPGVALMIRYNKLKKNWNILTLDGTQIHRAIKIDNPEQAANDKNDPTQMICSSCGKEINSSDMFCTHCGTKNEK